MDKDSTTQEVDINRDDDKTAKGNTLTPEEVEQQLTEAEALVAKDLQLDGKHTPEIIGQVVKFLADLALTYGFLGKSAGVDKEGRPVPKFHCSLAQSYTYKDRAGHERRVLPLYAVCYNMRVNYGVVARAIHHVLFGGYEGDLRIDTEGIDLSDPKTAQERITAYLRHVWRCRILTGKAGAALDGAGSISLRDSHFAKRDVGSSRGIGRDIPTLLVDEGAVTYEALLALQKEKARG